MHEQLTHRDLRPQHQQLAGADTGNLPAVVSMRALAIKVGLALVALALAFMAGFENGKASLLREQAGKVVQAVQEGAQTAQEARSQGKSRATQREAIKEAQKEELNEALKAAPDWADDRVPDGVWEALGGK